MTTVDVDRFRRRLEEEQRRVRASIEHLRRENPGSIADETGELVTGSENHLGDLATATYDRELEYGLEEDEEELLVEIEAALGRIDAGTYGICEVCGKEIGEERLEAIPWTRLCIDDARKAER